MRDLVDWNGNLIQPMTSEEIAATRKYAILNGQNPDQAVADAEGFRTEDRNRQATRDALFAERQANHDRLQKVIDDANAASAARVAEHEGIESARQAEIDTAIHDENQNPFAGNPGPLS